MPELPEVETIKVGLEKRIVGKTIKDIKLLQPKSFTGDANHLKKQKIVRVWRRAKILGFDLTNNLTILFHLKMTGQLIFEDSRRLIGGHPTLDMMDKLPNPHTRVIFEFKDKSHLYFNDQRRFGWVRVVEPKEGKKVADEIAAKLGPEPLEKIFTWQVLKKNLLRHKKMPVKVAMLDQTVVSGVGNIYASEGCFNAKLDPVTKVGQLTDEQFKKLHEGLIKALKDGIKYGGSSKTHFVDADGHKGYFLDYAFVYGWDKHPCKVCGTVIKKITLGGRGTYFCPKCQK